MSETAPVDLAAVVETAGSVTGIAAVMRGETARWEEAQALRRRLAALERPRSPG